MRNQAILLSFITLSVGSMFGCGGSEGTAPNCGDGVVQSPTEQCDDGNRENGDQCTNECRLAACGDGIVWTGVEPCDDGNRDNDDGCRNDCTMAACGDGFIQVGEAAMTGTRSTVMDVKVIVAPCPGRVCRRKRL